MLDHPGLANLLFSVLTVWPFARILRRTGLNPAYSLLVFVPVVGMVLVLAVLAGRAWPTQPPCPEAPPPKRRRVA